MWATPLHPTGNNLLHSKCFAAILDLLWLLLFVVVGHISERKRELNAGWIQHNTSRSPLSLARLFSVLNVVHVDFVWVRSSDQQSTAAVTTLRA